MILQNSQIENIALPGTYGDGRVLLSRCAPARPNGVNVVLLHGVHSSANLGLHNKFRTLAEQLLSRGYAAWLVETSRRVRNRQAFGDDVAQWVDAAFAGKTFAEEQQDDFIAVGDILKRLSGALLWVWGFSLGGIIALSAAAQIASPHAGGRPAIDGVVLSGTGLVAYPEVESWMMKMPVLSTLRQVLSPDLVSRVRTSGLISFRGGRDEIFSLRSCLSLIREVPLPEAQKFFFPVKGADHAMRTRFGKTDPSVMAEMAGAVDSTWGAGK